MGRMEIGELNFQREIAIREYADGFGETQSRGE